jgi:acyl-coenzyme A thioesterase PaaI-like protein
MAFEERRNDLLIMRHLCMRLDLSHPREVSVRLTEVSGFHRGGMRDDSMNCAVLTSLLDCAVATAGMLQFPEKSCGTVQLSVTIMRPVFGPLVRATGYAFRRAYNIVFTGAELFDGARVSAVASGIVVASMKDLQAVNHPLGVSA